MKPGYKQTEVGVIPEEWEVQRLGSVGHWFSGGTPSMANDLYWNGDIPWVSAKDMKVSRLLDSLLHVTEKAIGNGTRIAPAGAVLIVVRGMILAHTFPVAVATRPVAFNQDMKALVARAGIDSEFILVWLQASAKGILGITSESTHGTKRLASDDLFSTKVGVPPLPEQRAIATALSDVDGLLGGLDRLIAKKRDLKQAAMQQLLTGQTRLPGFHGEWEVKRLGEVGRFLKGSGVTKDQTRSGTLACVRYGELYTQHNDVVRDFHSWISPGVAATAVLLKPGDILFAGSGETKEEIGKCAAFVSDIEAYAGGDIVILRPDDSDSVFLGYYLNTSSIARQKASRGQGDAVVHISSSALSDVRCRLPPLPEQTAIASVLTEMDAELAALEQRREKTRALKQAMMQELLTGRTRLL